MEAVCALLAVERNPEWLQRLDDIIAVIGKAQRPDGYIHTPVLIAARNGDTSAKPFADRFNFEMYNIGLADLGVLSAGDSVSGGESEDCYQKCPHVGGFQPVMESSFAGSSR